MAKLTQEYVKSILNYSPITGIFVWRVSIGSVSAGKTITHTSSEGYVTFGVGGKVYKAHRVAWLYVYGTLPDEQIDHINGIRNDNRICNLRNVTHAENMQNTYKPYKNNTCGYLGVNIHRASGKFEARIGANGRRRRIGLFDTAEAAAEAYSAAKKILHIGRD